MTQNLIKSQTKENYLKALYHLMLENGEVTINDLSQRLSLKMPTVTSMIQKLADEKLVNYEKYKPVSLTEKGKKEAGLIIRKHRLTEMFLVEYMHLGWEEVHEIAEQIEHIKSPVFFQKMDEMLGYPSFDPHGSPIPDVQGNLKPVKRMVLSDVPPGQSVVLKGLAQSADEFLKFLNSKNISLGVRIEVIKKEPFDGSMVLKVEGKKMEASAMVCDQLFVEKQADL